MKKEGGSHLPAPPTGCPCHDDDKDNFAVEHRISTTN
jgi:hypothetical protein